MKSLLCIVALAGLGMLASCAASTSAKGGDRSLVDPSQPHAILVTGLAPAGASFYPVQIVWLDGDYLSTGPRRDTFWVAPGRHTIGFRAIINASHGPSVMMSPASSAPQDMPKLTVDLKQGYSYYFAARIPDSGNPAQWEPVVVRLTKSAD